LKGYIGALKPSGIQSIEQIILNLIINASQAIDHDRGKVEIVTGFGKRTGQIFTSISDNGRGIDPSISDRIFDPCGLQLQRVIASKASLLAPPGAFRLDGSRSTDLSAAFLVCFG
jgi:hypothetical protein